MPDVETRLARLAADLSVEVPDGLEAAVMTRVRTPVRSGAGGAGWRACCSACWASVSWPRPSAQRSASGWASTGWR